MVSSPTNSLRLEKQGQGEHLNTWGSVQLNNVIDMIDAAIAGTAAIVVTGSFALTSVNYTADQARNAILSLTGTPAAPFTVTTPGVSKIYYVRNATGQTATFACGAGATATVPTGQTWILFCDGTNWAGIVLPATLDQNQAAVAPVNFGGQAGVNAANPLNPQDLCTKAYADALAWTANAGILPAQIGNNGGVLATDGTTARWVSGVGKAGQILTTDGTTVSWMAQPPRGYQVFTTSGPFAPVANANMYGALVIGGGGGGGGPQASNSGGGQGGAGGGAAYAVFPALNFPGVTVTVGSGGVGGSSGNGGVGGASSFGSYITANGGSAGSFGSSSSVAGATASSTIPGALTYTGGAGGGSQVPGTNGSGAPGSATTYTAGGGGGCNANGGGQSGGAGGGTNGGVAGTTAGTAGGAGTNGSYLNIGNGGGGGGGANGVPAYVAGAGGAGATGSGGGGGANSGAGSAVGHGGAGGNGIVIVWWW